MKNSELQQLLSTYPSDLDIKILVNNKTVDYTGETLVRTSETAKLIENNLNNEGSDYAVAVDDKQEIVDLGNGKQYILLNSIIY